MGRAVPAQAGTAICGMSSHYPHRHAEPMRRIRGFPSPRRSAPDRKWANSAIRDIGLVFQGDYLTSFGLDRICEKLEAVTALAGDYQVPWELSDLVRRTYRRALARYGPVDGELLAVALLEEQADNKLRPRNS